MLQHSEKDWESIMSHDEPNKAKLMLQKPDGNAPNKWIEKEKYDKIRQWKQKTRLDKWPLNELKNKEK